MALSHRLHVLLDDEQFAILSERSAAQGRSVGALIREAVDLVWRPSTDDRREALDIILNATPMEVPDPEDLRAELAEIRAGRFE